MTKYYSDKTPYGGSVEYEEVTAVSDRANARGMYPKAVMTVRATKPREHMNFNQLKDISETKPRSQAEQQVYNATGFDRHELAGEASDSHYYAVNAAQEIEKTKKHSAANFIQELGETDGRAEYETSKYNRRRYGVAYAKSVNEIHKATTQMFTPEPGSAEVRGAFAHTSMKAAIPVMGAYFHQKYGELTASEDLSEHSSRMTEHAEKLGLPVKRSEDNPGLDVTNSYTFDNRDMVASATPFSTSSTKRIPDETMRSAKQHYKALRGIGKNTPKPLSPQFSQPQLPGMEDK
jgi:hypothetical protein